MDKTADCETPFATALIVAFVTAATALVVIVNVAVELPAATIAVAGTVAAVALLVNASVRPPAGAAPSRVTVAETELPPTTDDVASVTDSGCGGSTVIVACSETPFADAVIVAVVFVATGDVDS